MAGMDLAAIASKYPRFIFLEKEEKQMIDTIPDIPNEKWKVISGYDGKYLISNYGRTKSLKYRKAKILTAFVNNKGYERVALCQDG